MTVGIVGLGNMGSALAANLAATGDAPVTHDVAGPRRSPERATFVDSVAEVARLASTVVLSLPDGAAAAAVAAELASADRSRVDLVIETSTIGVDAARAIDRALTADEVDYVDAPVSGGVAGARARTLMVMYAAPEAACIRAEPILARLSDRRRQVGHRPGMAQAVKLLNNFLSATALAATSEAMAFAEGLGLDPSTVLDVLNVSSGRSAATEDKFPNQVITGTYAAGFANSLMAKDLRLYLDAVEARGAPAALGRLTVGLWERFATTEPDADFTRIYPFVADEGRRRRVKTTFSQE